MYWNSFWIKKAVIKKQLGLVIFIATILSNVKIVMVKMKHYQSSNLFDEIKPLLKYIKYLKKSDTWKIQLMIVVDFMSSEGIEGECVMHSKSDSLEIMLYDETDEVIKELFELLLSRCQIDLDISMKSSEFVFDYVDLLYYKCYKTNLNYGGSYIFS